MTRLVVGWLAGFAVALVIGGLIGTAIPFPWSLIAGLLLGVTLPNVGMVLARKDALR